MKINRKFENSGAAWFWRFVLGPAQIIDGAITTCSFTFIHAGLALWTSRQLAKARLNKLLERY